MVGVCWLTLLGMNHLSISNQWVRLIVTSVLGALFYIGTLVVWRPPIMPIMEQVMGQSGSPLVLRALSLLRLLNSRAAY
jgi:hypothetical protein